MEQRRDYIHKAVQDFMQTVRTISSIKYFERTFTTDNTRVCKLQMYKIYIFYSLFSPIPYLSDKHTIYKLFKEVKYNEWLGAIWQHFLLLSEWSLDRVCSKLRCPN